MSDWRTYAVVAGAFIATGTSPYWVGFIPFTNAWRERVRWNTYFATLARMSEERASPEVEE